MTFLESVVQVFGANMQEVRDSIEYTDVSLKVRPRVMKLINRDVTVGEDLALITAFVQHKTVTDRIFFQGFLLRMAATFENLQRNIMMESLRHINKKHKIGSDFSNGIVTRNKQLAGYALITIYSPPDFPRYDYDEICRAIGTCHGKSGDITLSPEVFSGQMFGITLDRIGKVFGFLSVDLEGNNAERLCTPKVVGFLGKKGVRENLKELEDRLLNLQKMRNRLAHGDSDFVVDKADVVFYCELLSLLSVSIADCVESEVNKKLSKP